jgi:hypothetical protein
MFASQSELVKNVVSALHKIAWNALFHWKDGLDKDRLCGSPSRRYFNSSTLRVDRLNASQNQYLSRSTTLFFRILVGSTAHALIKAPGR